MTTLEITKNTIIDWLLKTPRISLLNKDKPAKHSIAKIEQFYKTEMSYLLNVRLSDKTRPFKYLKSKLTRRDLILILSFFLFDIQSVNNILAQCGFKTLSEDDHIERYIFAHQKNNTHLLYCLFDIYHKYMTSEIDIDSFIKKYSNKIIIYNELMNYQSYLNKAGIKRIDTIKAFRQEMDDFVDTNKADTSDQTTAYKVLSCHMVSGAPENDPIHSRIKNFINKFLYSKDANIKQTELRNYCIELCFYAGMTPELTNQKLKKLGFSILDPNNDLDLAVLVLHKQIVYFNPDLYTQINVAEDTKPLQLILSEKLGRNIKSKEYIEYVRKNYSELELAIVEADSLGDVVTAYHRLNKIQLFTPYKNTNYQRAF